MTTTLFYRNIVIGICSDIRSYVWRLSFCGYPDKRADGLCPTVVPPGAWKCYFPPLQKNMTHRPAPEILKIAKESLTDECGDGGKINVL